MPVHTIEELYDLKFNRLSEYIDFYGVIYQGKLIAATMLFKFNKDILHTQYFASDSEYSNMYPMNFLNYNIIKLAYDNNYKKLSFGISTENNGLYLNESLATFKEDFGLTYSINKTYFKEIGNEYV